MPFCKVPKELGAITDMAFGNLLIPSTQSFQRIHVRQFVALLVVAFATSEDKIPSPIFINE